MSSFRLRVQPPVASPRRRCLVDVSSRPGLLLMTFFAILSMAAITKVANGSVMGLAISNAAAADDAELLVSNGDDDSNYKASWDFSEKFDDDTTAAASRGHRATSDAFRRSLAQAAGINSNGFEIQSYSENANFDDVKVQSNSRGDDDYSVTSAKKKKKRNKRKKRKNVSDSIDDSSDVAAAGDAVEVPTTAQLPVIPSSPAEAFRPGDNEIVSVLISYHVDDVYFVFKSCSLIFRSCKQPLYIYIYP